jgi:hypothetical protein
MVGIDQADDAVPAGERHIHRSLLIAAAPIMDKAGGPR